MRIQVNTTLHCSTVGTIDIPVESWDEIKECFVKWDALHYTTDGEEWKTIELNSDQSNDCVDWKRPIHFSVCDDATGKTYYDEDERE